MAGFEVPADTSILCCEIEGVGKKYPLSAEKLSPVLSLIFVADFNAALDTCFALLKFGGAGHTAAIYGKNDARIREYGMRMPAYRVLVNTPAPQGSTGITTNVFPSMTLGCGAVAGNSTSDNIGPQHLMNIKRLAYTVRRPEEAFEMPLDYDKAPLGPAPSAGEGAIDRAAVVSAVERYLASRGIAVSPSAAATSAASCGCSTPPPPITQSAVANVAAEVVDRFLSQRGAPPQATPGSSQNPGGYS
jgi:acetaldehyde dehydrogenase (acetylating)